MAFKMKHKKGAFPYKSSPMKRAGDYDLVTGQRLSKEEADALIAEEGAGSVTSTYQDAIDRAKTPEEKAAAEAKMAELQAKPDPEDWKSNRQAEYPNHEDCIHALLDGGDTLTDLQAKRTAIKNKYPKE